MQAAVAANGVLPNGVRISPEDMEQIFKDIKESPGVLEKIARAIEGTRADTRDAAEVQREQVFNFVIDMAKITAPNYKAEIVAGLETLPNDPQLSEDAYKIWGFIRPALLLEPPPEILSELAEALGTTADLLSKAGTMAREKETEGILPGCEPTAEEIISLLPLPKIDYAKGLLFPTSKFNRNIPSYIGAVNTDIALDIPGNVDLSKSKKKIIFSLTQNGKPETITPYDLEVENALSNLFEDGHKEVTTQNIYAKMNGLTGTHGRSFSPGLLQEVKASIDKLANLKADITIVDGNNASHLKGNVLDTFYWERCFKTPGQKKEIKSGWISTRPGLFFQLEKKQGDRLKSTQPEQLNLSASGISITPLAQMIRRFCLEEISRIATAPSHEAHKNKFLLERFYTYDMDPTLAEVIHIAGDGVEIRPRQGGTANEKSKIRMAKKHRRELLQDILEHR